MSNISDKCASRKVRILPLRPLTINCEEFRLAGGIADSARIFAGENLPQHAAKVSTVANVNRLVAMLQEMRILHHTSIRPQMTPHVRGEDVFNFVT